MIALWMRRIRTVTITQKNAWIAGAKPDDGRNDLGNHQNDRR